MCAPLPLPFDGVASRWVHTIDSIARKFAFSNTQHGMPSLVLQCAIQHQGILVEQMCTYALVFFVDVFMMMMIDAILNFKVHSDTDI